MTPTRLHECPVCGQRFRDARGRGGHLATKQDPAHTEYRLNTTPPRDPRTAAPSTPAPPPPVPVPTPTQTPRPASTPPPTHPEPYPIPAAGPGLDMQAMLDHYANIWANPDTADAPRYDVPELEGASPFVRGLFIILTILASGFGLYFLVQSKRGANAPHNASRTIKPAAPTTDESEAYWRNLLGNAAIHNPRQGGKGGWP